MLKHPVVHLGDLRRIVNDLLEHAERVHGPEFTLEHDYYWAIDSDAALDILHPVTAVDEVGSLGDSWEFLMNMRDTDLKESGSSLLLIHAAPLLSYIGRKIGS